MDRTNHHLEIDRTTDDAGRAVLVLSGDVDLQTSGRLKDHIDQAAEAGRTVVLDLRDVRFMDSPGLGTLIYCHDRLAEHSTQLVVREPSGHVRDLFDLVRLEEMVPVEPGD